MPGFSVICNDKITAVICNDTRLTRPGSGYCYTQLTKNGADKYKNIEIQFKGVEIHFKHKIHADCQTGLWISP